MAPVRDAPADPRPGVAIVSDHVTPYRAHLHGRIAREIPSVRLVSLFVGLRGALNWNVDMPPGTNPVVATGGRDGMLDWLGFTGFVKGLRLLDRLRRDGVRVLVVNGYYRPSMLALLLLGRARGFSVFLRADSNAACDAPLGSLRRRLKRLLVPLVFARCDGFMPMGRLGQAYFESYGADPSRCFWMPYEPDYAFFAAADPASLAAWRTRHGLSPRRRRVLFVGRLAESKRPDLLVEAFTSLAAERPEWDLVVAGEGPLRDAVEAAIPAELRSRIRLVGFVGLEDLRSAYHSCDVLAVPSGYEPWAVVVNEAVAAGLVVVASDVVGAARELVADGVSGRIFRSGDAADLGRALREVTDPETHARLRGNVAAQLAAWRRLADPVEGLRRALAFAGLPVG